MQLHVMLGNLLQRVTGGVSSVVRAPALVTLPILSAIIPFLVSGDTSHMCHDTVSYGNCQFTWILFCLFLKTILFESKS